jgi:type I restriction enzyme S subunit
MQRLLTKGIGHTKFKQTKLGEIPDKWQVRTLEDCVRRDVPITYGIVQAGPNVPGGIPYVRTGDMSAGRLSKVDLLHTSVEIDSSYPRSRVKAGEIICALRGVVGSVLEIPEELEGANLSRGVARISPGHDIYRRYLLWALRSEYARREFDIFSNGTTFKEIPLAQLRTIKVAVPVDIKEQVGLATILDRLELVMDLRQRYEKKLMKLRAGLMQQLLTGKIRV